MSRWVAALVLLGGCHKLLDLEHVATPDEDARLTTDDAVGSDPDAVRVDAQGCPPLLYDEDADGLDDRCDRCPTAASNDIDTDSDGLPDSCDPDLGASGRDRILFAATFGSEDDTGAFFRANAVWTAGGNGKMQLAASGVLRTVAMYRPTFIEVRVAQSAASSNTGRITVTNTGTLDCLVTANNCSTGAGTCVTLTPGIGSPTPLASTIDQLNRIELYTSGTTTTCKATGNGSSSAVGGQPFVTDTIAITTNANVTTDIRSIVIYGEGL
jgi:hypothetical protein